MQKFISVHISRDRVGTWLNEWVANNPGWRIEVLSQVAGYPGTVLVTFGARQVAESGPSREG